MAKLSIARVRALPDQIAPETLYIIGGNDGSARIVFSGADVADTREIRGLTDAQIRTIVQGIEIGMLDLQDSAADLTDSIRDLFGKHESRLNIAYNNTVGVGRWPSTAVEPLNLVGETSQIAVFGNGFTSGVGLGGYAPRTPATYMNAIPVAIWSNVLQNTLVAMKGNNRAIVTNCAFEADNLVADGDALLNVKAVFEAEDFTKPNIVFLAYGQADAVQSPPVQEGQLIEFNSEYTRLISYIQNQGCAVTLVNIPAPDFYSSPTVNANISLFNQAIADVARNMNVELIDLTDLVSKYIGEGGSDERWDDLSTDADVWDAGAHYLFGTYVAAAMNKDVIFVKDGVTVLSGDNRWNIPGTTWAEADEIPGIPLFKGTAFAAGKALQTAWVWNTNKRLGAVVPIVGTGTNAFDSYSTEVAVTNEGTTSKYAYHQGPIDTSIFSAERGIVTDCLPFGLSKITYKVKDSTTSAAVTAYSTALQFKELPSIVSVGSMFIPALQSQDSASNRVVSPKDVWFGSPMDQNFTVAVDATVKTKGIVGIFSNLADTKNLPRPGEHLYGALGIEVDIANETAQIVFISYSESATTDMTKMPIGSTWDFGSMGDLGTGHFSVNLIFDSTSMQGTMSLIVKNDAGTTLQSLDIGTVGVPWNGYCGMLSDTNALTYSTKLHSLTYISES